MNVAISLGTLLVNHPVWYCRQHFHDESQVHISAVSVQYVPRFVYVKDEEEYYDNILLYAISFFFLPVI